MRFGRRSGVFLHASSLPGPHGVGDLGDGARTFLDFLARAGQRYWQFCPLGPTTGVHGESPYQSFSAFAGNPIFISLERLRDDGWLTDDELEPAPEFDPRAAEYEGARAYKEPLLQTAFERFEAEASESERASLEAFREREPWLEDYALFVALKEREGGAPWPEWPAGVRDREPDALASAREELDEAVRYREFRQFVFDEQWRALRAYADERGVEFVGDVPIYVGLDSADVWASPEAFLLDESGRPTAVAGVPPNAGDAGQRWGNPLYDWETLRERGYDWWLARFERLFDLADAARLDHFQAFDRYWAIPAEADDPAAGEWREGPGAAFFEAVREELGELPFIAEDLGLMAESTTSLRRRFDIPGMRVPVYADWCREGDRYQPMHYPEDAAAYSSTHDSDTVVGHYEGLSEPQRDCLRYNLGVDGSEIHWSMIDAVWGSEATLAFATVPDLLGLGSEARFNTPGTTEGNWRWRVTADQLTDDVAERLRELTEIHVR